MAQVDSEDLPKYIPKAEAKTDNDVALNTKKQIANAITPYHLAILHAQRLEQAKRQQAERLVERMKKMKGESEWYAQYAIQMQNRGLTKKAHEIMAYARGLMHQAANLQKRSGLMSEQADSVAATIPGIQANEADMAAYVKTMEDAKISSNYPAQKYRTRTTCSYALQI
ncbi:unnamed protein product [Amoebophrya sp. A120]|nr:unnamed protein product [Amoebophrya sp. A120]|eukprot:GSA120T00021136001.1